MTSVNTIGAAALPAWCTRLLSTLDDCDARASRVAGALTSAQLNWSPRPGAWSIGQCIDHLNVTNRTYFAALSAAVERAHRDGLRRAGPIRSTWFGRRFVAMLEPPVRVKTRTLKAIRPAERRHKAEVWPEFVRQHTHLRRCLESWASVDLNRAVFRNPLGPFGRLRAGTALCIIVAHDRRHVWQASRVRGAAGFPRS